MSSPVAAAKPSTSNGGSGGRMGGSGGRTGGGTGGHMNMGSGGMTASGSGGMSRHGGNGGGGSGGTTGSAGCSDAKQLWFDDFETGDYRRWTGKTYKDDWGNNCQNTAISTESAHSPTHSQRSEIVCAYGRRRRDARLWRHSDSRATTSCRRSRTPASASMRRTAWSP